MYKHMEFNPQRDFAPVALVGKAPVIIVARPDAPFSTLQEMISFAKANPDKITAGYPGNGTLGHVTGELLLRKSRVQFSHTQYKGSAAILTDLIGGHIDIGIDSMAAYVPPVQAGKIKGLAIAAQNRWAKLPNLPTVSESGLPGFEASVWYAVLAPAQTPQDVIQKLNAAVNRSLKSANTMQIFDNLGVQTSGGSPQELKAFIDSETQKWAPIIKDAKIEF
jgi:tripartite-type tricarboxylate transporter receptor subunit TctC